MRISRLDLLRYGKFTDYSISLPQSVQDFHLVIGPNEAGKSTIRSAILDLLFEIETRSAYNFLHPYSEMKLAALIENDNQQLDFYRTKARKQSLFCSISDAVLPQGKLTDFLGTTDRLFFDQMFGLDHERLVSGGNEILHAANDVGQILFQAATGIGSLGKARDALVLEADKLWARRKSGERAYYVAHDALIQAETELKQATVRAKDWMAAQASVTQWEQALDQSQQQYRIRDAEQARLERIRRVEPTLMALQEQELELEKLGEVIVLSSDVAQQLIAMELELDKANQEYTFNKKHRDSIHSQLKNIRPDESLLKSEMEIQALVARRQQIQHYETEIIKRQEEIKISWQQIEGFVHQLGWPLENGRRLAERLPALPIRTTITKLLKRYDVLEQAQHTTEEFVKDKLREIQLFDEQIALLSDTLISTDLRMALAAADQLGDSRTFSRRLESQVNKANLELRSAQTGLGPWHLEMETLRNLTLPSAERIAHLQRRQASYEASAATLLERLTEINAGIQNQNLEIAQYCRLHHPITPEKLIAARDARDAIWASIKSGVISPLEAAVDYEARICDADMVADQRYEKAQEASALQSKLDNLQRMQQQKADLQARIDVNQDALLAVQNEWAMIAKELGLATISLLDIDAWLQARTQVLRAFDDGMEAKRELAMLRRDEAEIKSALLKGMIRSEIKADASIPLPALVGMAKKFIEDAVESRTRRDELIRQREKTRLAIAGLEEKALTAQAELSTWKANWHKNLALANLPADTDIGAVEGALLLFNKIEEKLHTIDVSQKEQIDIMRAELSDFEQRVTAFMSIVAPHSKQTLVMPMLTELASQLDKAKSEQKEFNRLLREYASFEEKLNIAQIRINNTQAEIQSLLKQAKVTTIDELKEAIQRSNSWRRLNELIITAKETLSKNSDGLTRAQLEVELQSAEISQIPGMLSELANQKEALMQEHTSCSANLATAKEKLSAIGGQDQAARAESQRQAALAKMGHAAERYIKVYTSARLLRWAIDRYRETKQGPMLVRASRIFSMLTRGSFKKLVVDFDTQPLRLDGQRADGILVGISGMSDGTRDQLYLALRLAALELHLEQAKPLPFIADDLFINYDDKRAKAGFEVLASLSEKMQVIFLSHHHHLVPVVQAVFGKRVNIVSL